MLAFLLLPSLASAQLSKEERKQGFKPMFNGKNLKGWDGDPRLWRVENGIVIGNTDNVKLQDNSFLICKQEYSDFILRAQVRLRNHNSGIQFRSEALPNWVVKGLQADLAEGNWWGSIYDEKGTRGVISNGWKGKAEKVVKPKDWNDYEILADGEKIELRVNGLLTSAIEDNSRRSGVIALQLHRGPGMQVEFRNVRIKKLR
ncbi:MAG: DUF1080 domain-containing protein [Bryobacteraceae bacterium]|nr:DUF1080 domain-containing protein [Bryobacteraceae bacterium]MDW8377736.1 DUF1080 domain-containing protein [Bryobacterales bacterium]